MTDDRYSRLAAEHLPGELAERWTALLRPCVLLRPAEDGEAVAAVLGGEPELPAGVGRPEWAGHGPLSFIAAVHCAALPREGLAEQFPQEGTLLFFYFDGQTDGDAFVSHEDPESWAGTQVLYVPQGTPVLPAGTPPELEAYPRVELTADAEQSAPDLTLPQARKALLGDHREWPHPRETPAELKAFLRAFKRLRGHIGHQVGGHALPIQNPVEYDVSCTDLDDPRRWGDPVHDEQAQRWVPLAQFDSDDDADMTWGDEGALYWLIRPEDLAARRFDRARLTVQC